MGSIFDVDQPAPVAGGVPLAQIGAQPQQDPRDFSAQYNTPLTPPEEQRFQQWAQDQSQKTGRNVAGDTYDYDLRGWWKQNQDAQLNGAHLTDTFKKPNHPTFSDQSQYNGVNGNQAGQWAKNPNGSWSFVPGATTLGLFSPRELADYFQRVEPGNQLTIR